jgi:hypothetical protein
MPGEDLCTLILASQSQPACLCHLNEIQNLFHISFGEPRECRAETPSDYHQTVRQKSFNRIIIRCRRRGQIRTSLLDGVPRNLSKWMQRAACLLFLYLFDFFFLSFERRWWWTSGLDYFPASYGKITSSRRCADCSNSFRIWYTKNKKQIISFKGWPSLSPSFFCGRRIWNNSNKQMEGGKKGKDRNSKNRNNSSGITSGYRESNI